MVIESTGKASPSPNVRPKEQPEDKPRAAAVHTLGLDDCPKDLSKERAEELKKEANVMVFKGANKSAIARCECALTYHRVSDCHRILAIAYKNTGDKKKACRSFDDALASNPRNSAALERQRDQLGCGSSTKKDAIPPLEIESLNSEPREKPRVKRLNL